MTRQHPFLTRCVLALVVLMVAVTACTGGGGQVQPSAGATPQTQLLGSMPTKPVTLTVWDANYFEASGEMFEGLKKVDQAFMDKYPNVTIKHAGFPFGGYWPTKVQTVITSKRGPDVMMVYPNPPFYRGLWPLNGLLTEEQREEMQLLVDLERADPSLHQLPYTTYAYVWLYNKELFRTAGLDPDSPPDTWEQMLAACDTLKAAEITPIGAGFKDGHYGGWLVNAGFYSQLFTPEELETWGKDELEGGWTNPTMRGPWELLSELSKRGCFSRGAEGKVLADVQPEFNSKKAAMIYTLGGNFAGIEKEIGKGNLGAFRMPLLPDSAYPSRPMDSAANSFWAITRFTPNCRVAWEYLSFLLSKEGQEIVYKSGGLYPNNKNVKATAKHPLDKQVLEWLTNPDLHSGAPGPRGPEEGTILGKGYPQLVAGQISIDDVLEDLQAAREREAARDESGGGGSLKKTATPRCE